METLRAGALAGSFTRRENLHLTLAFLGESEQLAAAVEAVEAADSPPFSLRLKGLGRFRGKRGEGGDLVWLGVEENEALQSLHFSLCSALRARGFALEKRPFRPHLTLGRRVQLSGSFDASALDCGLPEIGTWVEAISLMRSDRVGGVLQYTELHKKHFGRPL